MNLWRDLKAFLAWRKRTVIYRWYVPAGQGLAWSDGVGRTQFHLDIDNRVRTVEIWSP